MPFTIGGCPKPGVEGARGGNMKILFTDNLGIEGNEGRLITLL